MVYTPALGAGGGNPMEVQVLSPAPTMKPIVVAGPTASGKTSLGIALAKRFGGVVISADSRMVYRRLDIGTGKPTWEHKVLEHSPWLEPRESEFGPIYSIDGVDHYAIDLVDPEAPFTLTDWLNLARPLIADLSKKNIQPVIVGGTHMYLKALIEGFEPAPTDPALRSKLDLLTTDVVLAELMKLDPETAQRESKNRRRLVRALEVSQLGGKMSNRPTSNPVESTVVALKFSNEALYQRIDQRIDERLEAGMVDEVRSLIVSGVCAAWMKSLGLEYRIITEWIESGDGSIKELRLKLRGGIHAFARRQNTYLRHQLSVNWVSSIEEAVCHFERSEKSQ